jgi:hypothetical protein
VYTFFAPYSPFYSLSLPPPLTHCCHLPPLSDPGKTCCALLVSDFIEEKREKIKKDMMFLFV